jgi:hypothetical protein
MSKSITASEKNQSPNAAASPPQPLVPEQETIKELLANKSTELLETAQRATIRSADCNQDRRTENS